MPFFSLFSNCRGEEPVQACFTGQKRDLRIKLHQLGCFQVMFRDVTAQKSARNVKKCFFRPLNDGTRVKY